MLWKWQSSESLFRPRLQASLNGKRFPGVARDAQAGAALSSSFLELHVAAKAQFVKNGLQLAIGPGIVAGGALGRGRSLLKLGFIKDIFFVLVAVVAVQAVKIVHVLLMGETNGLFARVAECLAVIQKDFIRLSP
jgi:hypothetical protein